MIVSKKSIKNQFFFYPKYFRFRSKAEDAYHNLDSHRIVHLHAKRKDDITGDEFTIGDMLPEVRARMLRSIYAADDVPRDRVAKSQQAAHAPERIKRDGFGRAPELVLSEEAKQEWAADKVADLHRAGWGLLKGRPTFVRCFEYHSYQKDGSVMDHMHRDQGSLVTMSVLLSKKCDGGVFRAHDGKHWVHFQDLKPGDAVIFNSEKRHGVTPLTCGTREALVMEIWDQGVNKTNRHK